MVVRPQESRLGALEGADDDAHQRSVRRLETRLSIGDKQLVPAVFALVAGQAAPVENHDAEVDVIVDPLPRERRLADDEARTKDTVSTNEREPGASKGFLVDRFAAADDDLLDVGSTAPAERL